MADPTILKMVATGVGTTVQTIANIQRFTLKLSFYTLGFLVAEKDIPAERAIQCERQIDHWSA